MAAADGKSDNGRRGAPSLEKKENLKPRFSGPNPRSKTTFWTKSKEHDNNNKQDIKIKSIGSIEGSSVSVFQRERKPNGKLILNFCVNKAIMHVRRVVCSKHDPQIIPLRQIMSFAIAAH